VVTLGDWRVAAGFLVDGADESGVLEAELGFCRDKRRFVG
jgi:hypothetical protein